MHLHEKKSKAVVLFFRIFPGRESADCFLAVSMFYFYCTIFLQWLFDEHGTPVSHFSVGAGFSKSTQTSTARWYDHQYDPSRWLLAEAWFSGV